MHDIFAFEQTGVDDQKAAVGTFHATGVRPRCLERLAATGLDVDPQIFERRSLEQSRLDQLTYTNRR